jgi:hypothetical protein
MFPRQSVKHVLGLIRQESGGTRHRLSRVRCENFLYAIKGGPLTRAAARPGPARRACGLSGPTRRAAQAAHETNHPPGSVKHLHKATVFTPCS